MSVPVGLTVPKLLPITGTFTPLFAFYYTLLSGRVMYHRVIEKKYITTDTDETNQLTIATRCHGNFAENVPFALLLGAVVELNGGNRKALTAGFATLFVLRVLHVEFGLRGKDTLQGGRLAGFVGTLSAMCASAGYAAYLVRGYWDL